MTAWHKPWAFNEVLLVSLPDANLFCRPGNATGVVSADPKPFFFTDTAGVYTEIMTYRSLHQWISKCAAAISVFNFVTDSIITVHNVTVIHGNLCINHATYVTCNLRVTFGPQISPVYCSNLPLGWADFISKWHPIINVQAGPPTVSCKSHVGLWGRTYWHA